MACRAHRWQLVPWLLLLLAVVAVTAAAAAEVAAPSRPAPLPPCGDVRAGRVTIAANCSWTAGGVPAEPHLVVAGAPPSAAAPHSSASGTPFIHAAGGSTDAVVAPGADAGTTALVVERVVLVGFSVSPPGGAQPPLWPEGLTAGGSGSTLNLTDVRIIVHSQELFSTWASFFAQQKTLTWTDDANVLHIQQWSDARTRLHSVGLLLAPPAAGQTGGVAVKTCLVAATNDTLVPALQPLAAVNTPAPLIVYLTSNVSIGAHLPLPASGVAVRRPVVFVGLVSQPTSIDFEMVVNQLNASLSDSSNVTFVAVLLENLAPGDAATSAMAAPFSIAITNNVFAVYYNRSVPNKVRLVHHNTTMVLAQESEMSYVIYMFTLFTSPLPYLKQQTTFYTDVMHMSMLQFTPGPGSHAITVTNLKSWYSTWANVVMTAGAGVAAPLPLPARPAVLTSATRASPLVQAVRTPEELQSFAESAALGGREHILLFLSNVTLPHVPADSAGSSGSNISDGQQVNVGSQMTWLGYSGGPAAPRSGAAPASGRRLQQQQQQAAAVGLGVGGSNVSGSNVSGSNVSSSFSSRSRSSEPDQQIALGLGFTRGAVQLPQSGIQDVLQLQQLVLWQLPQGPGAAEAAASVAPTSRALPDVLPTLMLWAFARPAPGSGPRSLHLDGVVLKLPEQELDVYKAYAAATDNFVFELTGPSTQALTFQGAYVHAGALHVASLTGPGFLGTNVTLRPDASAAAAMPGGFHWPDAWQLRMGTAPQRQGKPSWAIAVIAVCVTVGVLVLALAGFMWWQRRRLCLRDPEAGGHVLSASAHRKSTSVDSLMPRGSQHSPGGSSGGGCNHQQQPGGGVDGSGGGGGGGTNLSWPASGASGSPCAACRHDNSLHVTPCSLHSTPSGRLPPPSKRGSPGGGAGAATQQQQQQQQQQQLLQGPAAVTTAAATGSLVGNGADDVPAPRDNSAAAAAADARYDGLADSGSSLQDSVAMGMQRWRQAVSSTTMLLMERRMDAAAALGSGSSGSALASTGRPQAAAASPACKPLPEDGAMAATGLPLRQQQQQQQQQQQLAAQQAQRAASDSPGQPQLQQPGQPQGQEQGGGQQLVLQELLGQGSFGSVFLATWRGKRVAVKVMQLPASALLEPGEQLGLDRQQQAALAQQQQAQLAGDSGELRRRARQRQQAQQAHANSKPHMLIMEAVVSSAMSHPNVVQVYTYTLTPLTSREEGGSLGSGGGAQQGGHSEDVAGFSLRLVMEYADTGSLREALDCGLLAKPGGFLPPSAVLALAHDVSAAMLHLHSEGIVHGDLKAGNVMLTSSGAGGCSSGGLSNPRVWAGAPGDRPLTAKVADFGLAFPLPPTDTHATLLARGTPTHMSPELFTAGHISKASDVYAFGVLLYEVITGQRAYAGVPIPLLPHEVAVQGLRPTWPEGMPPGCRDLRKLAEACWAHNPQDRPSFAEILRTLDIWASGGHGWPATPPASSVRTQRRQQQQQPVEQQQQQPMEQQPAGRGGQPAQPLPQQPQQQVRWQAAAPSHPLPAQPPAAGGVERDQQQRHPPERSGARGAADAPAARNRQMSWSEVDFRES